MPTEDIYTVGGTVRLDRGIYIPRQTDEELLAYCRAGLFAYVLTSRQLGKSSLMVHTARRLNAEGKRTAIIDLGQIGTATPEQWYLGVIANIAEELGLKMDVVSWWSENPGLSVTNRLTAFFEHVLRNEIAEQVIIFMDEIDTTLNLEFRDDFFAGIRYFYNARAHKPEFNRLTFVLIGTATPGDLIDDPLRTPFNIGHWVVLSDFTLEEAMPLAEGLGLPNGESEQVMRWILEWTGGHPYLTQRICQVIAAQKSKVSSKQAVDSVVANIFLGEKGKYEGNLEFVRDMLTRRMRRTIEPSKLLSVYGKILRGRFVPDEEHSLIKNHLKLSGVVRREGTALRVRNPIYGTVFNTVWVNRVSAELPTNWRRRLTWIAASLIVLVLITLIPLSGLAINRARVAERALADATRATENEKLANQNALMALQREREARQELEQVLKREQAAKSEVQESLDRETAAKGEALRQRSIAEEQRETADNLRQIALSREVAANAISRLPANPELSVLLATEALRLSETSEAKDSLRQALVGYRLTATFRSHKSPVRQADYSPDGKSIVSVSDDKAVVWDAATREILFELKGENGQVNSAAFSPDSKRIITVEKDGTAHLWNATTGLGILVLQGHSESVVSGAFSPDSKLVVTASLDNTQRVWDVETGRCIFVLSTPVPAVPKPESKSEATPVESRDLFNTTTKAGPSAHPNVPEIITVSALSPLAGAFSDLGVFAQTQTTGSIEGQVTDPDGKVVPNATVTVLGSTLITPLTAQTDERGRFRILNLPPGRYTVSVAATARFAETARNDVEVNLFRTSTADVKVRVAGTSAEVTITDTSGAAVDVSADTLGTNVSNEQFNNFPTQRSVQSLYSIAPPVSRSGSRHDSGRADNTNDVLDDETEPLEKELPRTTARFSADGKFILAQDVQGKATLWRVETGQSVFVLKGYRWVKSPVFTPDGKYIVASVTQPEGPTTRDPNEKLLNVWNASNGESLFEMPDDSSDGFEPSVSPDGKYIVAGGNNNIVVLRDIETRRDTYLQGHGSPLQSATFSPNGNYLATTDVSNTVRVWDLNSGRGLFLLQGHTNTIFKAAFSSDSRSIATASGDHTVRLWNISHDLMSVRLSDVEGGRGDHGVFSPNAKSVAVNARLSEVTRVYDTANGKRSFQLEGRVRSNLQPAFSPNGNYLVAVGDTNTPQVANARTGERMFLLRGHTAEVLSATFSSDSHSIITAADDKTARVWDARNGQNTFVLTGHRNKVNSAEFSPDGAHVVTASSDNTTRLWDGATGKQLRVFFHLNNVLRATFTPNGAFIVTVEEGGWTQVWNVLTDQQLSALGGSFPDSGPILSPDGLSIATLGPQNTVVVSSIATGNRVAVLEGHTDTVSSVSFSPNSEVIVTTGEDHTMRIWNARRGAQLGVTEIDRDLEDKFSTGDSITTTFSSDSRRIFILNNVTILQTYLCEICDATNGLITSAQSRITRRLDPREREIYLHLTESK